MENAIEPTEMEMAFDVYSLGSERWINWLTGAEEGQTQQSANQDPDFKLFMDDLLSFDGNLVSSSTAALKYILWREAIRPLLTAENVGNLVDAFDGKAEATLSLQPTLNG